MFAILNYFENPTLNNLQIVKKGDKVKGLPSGEEVHITANKEYTIIEVEGVALITIKNDIGKIETYTVEYFWCDNTNTIHDVL